MLAGAMGGDSVPVFLMRECTVIRMERKGMDTNSYKKTVREEAWLQERSYGVGF